MKKFDAVLILLLMLQISLGGCDIDEDPTDEWVGTWTLETWNGTDWEKSTLKETIDAIYKAHLEAGNTKGMWNMFVGEIEVTVKFTFDSNSRWEYRQDVTMNPSSYTKKNRNNPDEYIRNVVAAFTEWFKLVNKQGDVVATGSYIISEENFVMTGDSGNISGFRGLMSGIWKRTEERLTLIGDSESRLGTMILSK